MAQTFRIATSSELGTFRVIGDKSKVSETLFWQTVNDKVKLFTAEQPEKFDEVLNAVKTHLKNKTVTVGETWFEIKGKP